MGVAPRGTIPREVAFHGKLVVLDSPAGPGTIHGTSTMLVGSGGELGGTVNGAGLRMLVGHPSPVEQAHEIVPNV